MAHDFLKRRCCGNDRYIAAYIYQIAQDIVFDTIVDGDNLFPPLGWRCVTRTQLPKPLVPAISLQRRHILRKVHALQPSPGLRTRQHGGHIEVAAGGVRDDRIWRASDADKPSQRAGVDARYADTAVGLHPCIEMLRTAEI